MATTAKPAAKKVAVKKPEKKKRKKPTSKGSRYAGNKRGLTPYIYRILNFLCKKNVIKFKINFKTLFFSCLYDLLFLNI